jgi:hypothetical protein
MVINPSFKAVVEVAEESAAGVVAGAAVAVSVDVVDDLEPSLQANVNEAIAAINNNFFMTFFLVLIVRKTMPFNNMHIFFCRFVKGMTFACVKVLNEISGHYCFYLFVFSDHFM